MVFLLFSAKLERKHFLALRELWLDRTALEKDAKEDRKWRMMMRHIWIIFLHLVHGDKRWALQPWLKYGYVSWVYIHCCHVVCVVIRWTNIFMGNFWCITYLMEKYGNCKSLHLLNKQNINSFAHICNRNTTTTD